MCLSCGKGNPNDDHGDSANITAFDVDNAAIAAGLRPADVARNIHDGVKNAVHKMSLLESFTQR
jgi:hypothetical protein